MVSSDDLLRSYCRLVDQLSGAEAVSVYVPPLPGTSEAPLLAHGGEAPAVPELRSVEALEECSREAEVGSSRERESTIRILNSQALRGRLIRIPADPWEPILAGEADARKRRKSDRRDAGHDTPSMWIGLQLAATSDAGDGEPISADQDLWRRLFQLGAALAANCRRVDAVLRDPVSELPGRADFQAALRREIAAAGQSRSSLGLILLQPDDFSVINERFGSDAGDRVVREIARRLRETLRRSDLVHRYGGVVFAAVLPGTSRPDAVSVAEKLHAALTNQGYLKGAARLGFCFGLASWEAVPEPNEERPERSDDAAWELIRRADEALNAARTSSSGRVVAWRPGSDNQVVVHRDRLNGIFTADLAKDYRNMLLLWDTVDMVTEARTASELARRAVKLLVTSFKPSRAGFLRFSEDGDTGSLPLVVAASHPAGGEGLKLRDAERALADEACDEGELVEGRVRSPDSAAPPASAYAVPLVSHGKKLGCLFLTGPESRLSLDASDLIFLKALADQLAAAIERAELAAREDLQKEEERQRLQDELRELRGSLEETQLVFESSKMESLLDTARRVAPTDATVLVTGESGTGKELVARAVHNLSPRSGKPPVVVDCAAISASLIDSELFGHERGAFTGAASRTVGRLAEAAGSTLILDEIGELPLEVQAKLLRFVQEKQITPVGSTRPRSVDVRLVAVTNRDLAAEVEAGRFRQDLYYRLKVVHLEVPPLAERPTDVPVLIEHFVRRFSARYGKSVRGLSSTAEALSARHRWPGNVRELENRILQAVLLSEGTEIGPEDLDLEQAMPPATATLEMDLGQLESRHIERVLASEGGSVARAARRLGIQRNTLYQKIKKYGLERPGR